MRWSFQIARITGIEVRIHITFLLLVAYYAFSFYTQGGPAAAVHGAVFICLVFLCVLLHEFGHALAARRYGIHTPDITLLPIGGVARLEKMPEKPSEELVVAICGPLVNVVIFLALLPFVYRDLLSPEVLVRVDSGLLAKLAFTNGWLVLFNMVPAFPMDGGRVLRALLAMRMDYVRATNIAATIGQSLAFTVGLLALLNGAHLLVLVSAFVFIGAQSEASHAQMRVLSNGLRVRDAMVTHFKALPLGATLHDAVELLLHTSQSDFPVVDEEGVVAGVLTKDDLILALRSSGAEAPVSAVLRRDIPQVHEMMHFDRAFRLMQEIGTPVVPVVNSRGSLVGLFTPENVGEFMMIQSALAERPALPVRRPPPLPERII